MSVYVYNIRKSVSIKASIDLPCVAHEDCQNTPRLAAACGKASDARQPIVVHALAYTCKYRDLPDQVSAMDHKYGRRAYPYAALMARIERAWGSERPAYVAITVGDNDDQFEDGALVYAWASSGFEWFDCNAMNGVVVGFLRKEGRKWVVESMSDVMARAEKLLAVLANGPWPWTLWASTLGCSETFARAVVNHLMYAGKVSVYNAQYTGEDDKPEWHGQLHARLREETVKVAS
jgi:hypothetical protein